VGDLALFVVYLDQLSWLPEEISRILGDLKRIDVSYGRLRAVVPGEQPAALVTPVRLELEVQAPRERLERLVVAHLGYRYAAGGGGIDDVSFALERGSITVITGRIGAGKTTLVHVLLGLLPRQRGEIQWNDRAIDDPAAFFVPPRSAFTPQVPRLFSESLRENLLLGRRDDDVALRRAVHAAVLEPDVASFERGLDTLVGPRGVKLSGGQVQRAAAARMFVRDAELLVVDDLSSALDTETEAELWSRLFGRGRDVTWLIVSHRPAALKQADQVLLLEDGQLTRVR
jgi:ATP-binding cassette subfamily B protein